MIPNNRTVELMEWPAGNEQNTAYTLPVRDTTSGEVQNLEVAASSVQSAWNELKLIANNRNWTIQMNDLVGNLIEGEG